MLSDVFENLTGVKIVALCFGFIGALLGISYTPQITPRTALAALLSGVVCGGLAPPLLMWALGWTPPPVVSGALAFIAGLGGMFIIPGLLALWSGFAKDPWAFIDRLRGFKKPPEPPCPADPADCPKQPGDRP